MAQRVAKAAMLSTVITSVFAQSSLYKPCPLLGPFVPPPRIEPSSPVLQSALSDFGDYVQGYVDAGDGEFGPISSNTTSFSIALFAGSNYIGGDDAPPYLFNFDHTASSAPTAIDANTIYALGELTQLFTVYTLLAEVGDGVWHRSITEYLPQLACPDHDNGSAIEQLQWDDVTLGALAGHMAGIARDSDGCRVDEPCDLRHFLAQLNSKPPVYLPDTTPIFSHAAFQLLAFALEKELGRPLSFILQDTIFRPLSLANTGLMQGNNPSLTHPLTNSSITGEPASLGMYSTIADLSVLGRSMLTNRLLPPAVTRRWLKPFTSTSNLRNAVGRPWEIYHYSNAWINPIVDIYTKLGSIGAYSSYFGLAPDYDVGFVILAVDETGSAPDQNAYGDMALRALQQIDQLARVQANATLAGTYRDASNSSRLTLGLTEENTGLGVMGLVVNGTDWLARIVDLAGINNATDLDFRLFPTNLIESAAGNGTTRRAFRGVVQDKSALVDAGTPTCISWMTVDELEYAALPVDEFVFTLDSQGRAESVASPALGVEMVRVQE